MGFSFHSNYLYPPFKKDPTGFFRRMTRAAEYGNNHSGFVGAVVAVGTAAVCDGVAKSAAVAATPFGKGDLWDKYTAEGGMFDRAMTKTEKAGSIGFFKGGLEIVVEGLDRLYLQRADGSRHFSERTT